MDTVSTVFLYNNKVSQGFAQTQPSIWVCIGFSRIAFSIYLRVKMQKSQNSSVKYQIHIYLIKFVIFNVTALVFSFN